MSSFTDRVRSAQARFESPSFLETVTINNYNPILGRYCINSCNQQGNTHQMVSLSSKMQAVFYLLNLSARSSDTTLIVGETGTGKELAGEALHYNGPRHNGKVSNYVVLNAASIPESLIESELFGYVKGAFTGAEPTGRAGAFVRAANGTIVFDEIADMPLVLQPRLLRVIEEKRVIRLGSDEYVNLGDIKIVASTNRDIGQLVEEGKFRLDLFYRLADSIIYMPTLKERGTKDIEALICYFSGNGMDKFVDIMTYKAFETLLSLEFPGNVRSLKHLVERARRFGDGKITSEGIEASIPYLFATEIRQSGISPSRTYKEELNLTRQPTAHEHGTPDTYTSESKINDYTLSQYERKHILEVLKKVKGNKKAAARLLGISRRALYRRLYRLDIPY